MQPYIWPKISMSQFLKHLFRRQLFATIATVKLRIPEFYTTLMVSNKPIRRNWCIFFFNFRLHIASYGGGGAK